MTTREEEDRQFAAYAERRAREDRETDSGRAECPKCRSHDTRDGYGFAAGGVGPYTICHRCWHVLQSFDESKLERP